MKELIDKYRHDELTPSELSELREKMRTSSDAEVEEHLFNAWLGDDIDTSAVSDEQMERKKSDIDALIKKKKPVFPVIVRWSQVAAAVLLPVFVFFSIYLYQERQQIMSLEEMVVTTGNLERASITLPDGTIVSLNKQSRLAYHPRTFNQRERTINFSGEGHFQVVRNESAPFLIYAKGLRVEVLGTVFNLSVRETDYLAMLSLEEGSVKLTSTLSNESVVLHQNQKAVLEHSTGKITLFTHEHIHDLSAWKRSVMIFRNAELSQIIKTIENTYAVSINFTADIDLTDRFTGTLPMNSLYEALKIIEHSYHLKAITKGREVTMAAR